MTSWHNDQNDDNYEYLHRLLKKRGLEQDDYEIYVIKETGHIYPKSLTAYYELVDGYLVTKADEHFHFATDINPGTEEVEVVIWQQVAPIDFWKNYPPYQKARKSLGI